MPSRVLSSTSTGMRTSFAAVSAFITEILISGALSTTQNRTDQLPAAMLFQSVLLRSHTVHGHFHVCGQKSEICRNNI